MSHLIGLQGLKNYGIRQNYLFESAHQTYN